MSQDSSSSSGVDFSTSPEPERGTKRRPSPNSRYYGASSPYVQDHAGGRRKIGSGRRSDPIGLDFSGTSLNVSTSSSVVLERVVPAKKSGQSGEVGEEREAEEPEEEASEADTSSDNVKGKGKANAGAKKGTGQTSEDGEAR